MHSPTDAGPVEGFPCGRGRSSRRRGKESAADVLIVVGPAGRIRVVFRCAIVAGRTFGSVRALPRGDMVMEGDARCPPGVVQVMSRVVLITGCSTGIGRTVMERLTVSGHAVVATAGRAGSLKGFAASSGLVLDVTDSAATDSCRRRDPAAARAYRRAAQRCRVRRPRSSRGGPGRCVPAMVDVNVFGVSRMVRPVAAVCDKAAGDVVRREERSPRPVGAVCTGSAR